jgi:hypothetical protein
MTINEETFKDLIADRERFYAVRDALTVHERKMLDERVVLEKIYAGQNLAAVNWRETPDFSVRLRQWSQEFGVEICRYYGSGSEARLKESPGYTQHLLSGGAVRHKDDVTCFSVTTVAIQNADGRIVAAEEPAVMRQMPTLAAAVEGIRTAIVEKDKLFPARDGLAHVNLVVEERTDILATSDASEFYRLVGRPLLNDAVFASRFREIFVISRFKSGPAYVPLKMLFTLARLYFFHDALAETQPNRPIEMHDYMALFAGHLRSLTLEPIGIRVEGQTAEVLFGDTGFVVAKDSEGVHTTLRMYRDAEWPRCEAASAPSSVIASQIQEKMRELMARSTFVSPIAFPVPVP